MADSSQQIKRTQRFPPKRSWLDWEKCAERRRRRMLIMRQNGSIVRRRQQVLSSVPAPEGGSAAVEAPRDPGMGTFVNDGGKGSNLDPMVVEANINEVEHAVSALAMTFDSVL